MQIESADVEIAKYWSQWDFGGLPSRKDGGPSIGDVALPMASTGMKALAHYIRPLCDTGKSTTSRDRRASRRPVPVMYGAISITVRAVQ